MRFIERQPTGRFINQKNCAMTSLSTTSAQTFITGYVTDIGAVAAVVLTATIGLGIAIWLVFKFLGWLRGAV